MFRLKPQVLGLVRTLEIGSQFSLHLCERKKRQCARLPFSQPNSILLPRSPTHFFPLINNAGMASLINSNHLVDRGL